MSDRKEAKPKLLDDSSSDSEVSFKINKSYATAYEKWRQGEELQKLKDKYGSDTDTSSSSESEEAAPVVEKEFLKTLSLLKKKDPQIYDEGVEFFTEESAPAKNKKGKEKKPKPLYPKDYERMRLLERNGEASGESDDEEGSSKLKALPPTYDEELEEIRKSFKTAKSDTDSENDADDNGESFLKVREKDQAKKKQEEDEYIAWLKGEKEHLKDGEDTDLEFLHSYWNDPKLDEDEKFLKDYILNKKYLEEEDEDDIPTYEEITNDVGTLSDDEKLLDEQDAFERKYNFRFEEPDQEFIKKYPRTIGDSLRRKDNKRKLKREEYQERKKREKEQKMEELKRLKALKRKEIEEKLEKLRETVGSEQLAFDDLDVEGEFDPEEHDRKMREMFNDDFYNVEETERPEFPADEDIDYENWDNWTGEDSSRAGGGYNDESGYDGPHCEDPDFVMDADYDPKLAFQKEMIESSTKRNKRHRKKSKFAEAVSKSKPVFDPSSKTFEKYVDEYYKLDCEDIIGDLPVRFKYRSVVPNDFGLSIDEILAAKDKELNRWCSVKKTCQYRKEQEELYDVQAFKKKAQSEFAKRKVFLSLYGEPEEQNPTAPGNEETANKKRKRKKKKKAFGFEAGQPEVERDNMESVKMETDDMPMTSLTTRMEDERSPRTVSPINESVAGNVGKQKRKRKRSRVASITASDVSASEGPDRGNDVDVHSPSKKSAATSEPANYSNGHVTSSKKKKKKKNKTARADENSTNGEVDSKFERTGHKFVPKERKPVDKRLSIPDSRLKAYGINPKKFKGRLKYAKKS